MKMLSACLLLLPFISCTQVQDTKNDAVIEQKIEALLSRICLLYTSPSPRDGATARMPSSA